MRILYVSQYFPPEMGAPAARVSELARAWVQAGHEVQVLTGFPNHPTGVVPPAYRGDLWRRERPEGPEGVEVLRVPIHAAPNRGFVRRALNYGSFALSSALVGPLLARRPDVLIATTPQILTAVSGAWLASLLRVPFVLEVRDLWPQSIVAVGALRAGSLPVKLLEALETALYRRADRIVAVSEAFVDEIVAAGGARERIQVITNGVDLALFSPQDRAAARAALGLPAGDFLASYVGTHGLAHGLQTLLEAARLLQAGGGAGARVRVLLVGEGAEKAQLVARARELHLDNVVFWSQRPRAEVAQVLAASDVALVLLKDDPLFRTVLPSKMFECMGAGRAMLSNVDGEARRLLERAGAGLFVPPGAPAALAGALAALAADPHPLQAFGASGRAWVEENASRPALARRYLDEVLLPLAAGSPRGAKPR